MDDEIHAINNFNLEGRIVPLSWETLKWFQQSQLLNTTGFTINDTN